MIKIKKTYNSKIISLIIVGLFILNSTAYGTDLPGRGHLRSHLLSGSPEGRERLNDGLAKIGKDSAVNVFEFEEEGLDIALKIFDSTADVTGLLHRLSEVRGVERVNWRQGELTIVSKTEVVKVHLKEQEINERLGLIDRFYVKHCATCGEAAVKIYHRDSRDEIKQQNKSVHILGVVRAGHDSVAALIKDGVLVGAIEEERLNFDKHTTAYFPKEAVRYLLKAYGITWEDIDHIAVSYDYNFYRETPGSKEPHYDYRQKHNLPFKEAYQRYDTDQYQSFLEDMAIGYGTGYIPPVTFVKHHKAHAAAAYYSSGFTEPTLVVSIDGQGEDESTTIWLAKDGKLKKIARTTPFTHSLGHFYHIITVYLGYRRNDEGNVMGYAPYGASRNREEEKTVSQLRGMMQELIRFDRKTEQIEMNQRDFESTKISILPGVNFSESFLQRLGKVVPPMPEDKTGRDLRPEDRNRAHLAFTMQERVEQVINDMISYYLNENVETRGVKHVVMGGGLALNIASNGKLIKNGTVEADKFFVPAYPADDGTAIGAALSVADEEHGLYVQNEIKKISFGKTYSDEEIQNVLDRFGLVEGADYQYIESDEQLVKEVADAIVDDKTVAWFQGGAELGPRALGNRSILNRLNDPEGNLKVNRIKSREPWRPSALSIQEEHAAEFLDGVSTSPFMTIAFPVREDKKDIIRAGAHPDDGTTRPQTVSHEANPLYWSLLGEMGKRTGVPGVLNTSFNKRGPIVETPEDALNTYFYGEGLDLLAIGHFIVRRKDKITPSVLNGGDELHLKDIFTSGRYKSEPLTAPWDKFWTEANNLAASRNSEHQQYLIVYIDDDGESREVLRVPLVKEMFQAGPREFMVADLARRIQIGIGRDTLTTIAIETTTPQFREVVVDLFEKFAPHDIRKNWNIVKLGFGEQQAIKNRPEQKQVNSSEAVESLNRKILKWQEEQRDSPILVAVTGPAANERTSLVDRLQGKHFVIDAGRWNLDESQGNNSLNYPFSHMRFNDYVNALERLQLGQTAIIPLRQTLPTGLPQRGFALLNEEMKKKYKSILVKESSKVWVRYDGQLFEEVKPEASDVFVVNTSVVLNYPVLRGLFEEAYFIATNEELKELSRTGEDGIISSSMRGVKFADTIVMSDAASKSDEALTSWTPLKFPQQINQFDSICIALTNYCPVGCLFCFMRSVQDKSKKISLEPEAIERILSYAKENQVFRIMLSGGEPLTEMATVLRVIREAEVPNITIFTSGYFAVNPSRAEEVLDQLVEAIMEREQSGKKPTNILFNVSVDEFHERRVPQKNIINIIKVFERHWNTKYANISLELKGILKDKDPIPELIESLNGKVLDIPQDGPFPTKPIILPSGYAFTVRYSEIKLLKDMLGTELAEKQFDKVYQRRLGEDVIYVGRGERNGASFSVNYDGVVSLNDYLAKNFVLGNANNDNFFENVDNRLTFDPLVVALREIGLNTVLDIASRLRPNIRKRSIETNNQFIAVSDILGDEELREYVYKELIQLLENMTDFAISRRNAQLSVVDGIDLNKEVFIIGDGRIELGGPVIVKGNKSQIRFQGENQENLVICIGKGFTMENCFISLRRSQGQAHVGWQGDTLVVEEMVIGEDVKITKGGEVMNVPRIGDGVEIEGSFLIEMDDGGVGDRAKILGNSETRLSLIGADVVIDQQSKIFKSIISSKAQIINANLIGGQDELVGGWRQKDDEGKGRGVIIGKGVEFRNGLAQHKGAQEGKINPITVADGVKLDGVFLISERNEGIHIAANLELASDQRVYIYDGVTVDEGLRNQIQDKLVTSDIVEVTFEDGTVKVEGVAGSLVTPKLLNVPQLKEEYATKKTRGMPKVYSIDTIQEAQDLNSLLLKSNVFISRAGEVFTSRHGRDDIAIRIGQGTFVYPGVEIYVNTGRTVDINLWDLGNRGGTLIIADEKDVQLGPKDRLAGRVVAAVIRDVDVDAEINNFGGVADTIVGNVKITIRNQGVLKNANLSSDGKGKGEVIWGAYQGKNVDVEVTGDVIVGLSYGGIIEGQSLSDGRNSIKLVSGFNPGYRTVIRDERQEPVEPILYDSSYNPTDFAMTAFGIFLSRNKINSAL